MSPKDDSEKLQPVTEAPPRSTVHGPRFTVYALLAVVILGVGLWATCLYGGQAQRAWRGLLINFAYFNALAAGMVVWSAVVMLSRGRWTGEVERSALAAAGFAPVAIAAFVALAAGYAHWATWASPQGRMAHQALWLSPPFLLARDGAALAILWALAIAYVRRRRRGRPARLAGVLTLTYCLVISLLGFDLVMALDPQWYSSLFGWYYFVSGMYAAAAGWTLTAVLQRRGTADQLHDLGKLIVAFSLLTTYMMYSQLLAIWYENLPQETRQVVPRLQGGYPWRTVSTDLLAVIYLGPLVVLLTRWSKRTPAFLASVAAAVLLGMWVERWWLITPMAGGEMVLGLPELALTVAFAAAFACAVMLCRPVIPPASEEPEAETSGADVPEAPEEA